MMDLLERWRWTLLEMFQRLEKLFGVRYSNYCQRWGCKNIEAILDKQPYSEDFKVIESECIGYVEKRMGSQLRNIKNSAMLRGKAKLTDGLIKKLTKYYGLAIRQNVDSVSDMKKAVMATYCH
ncbi:hypothetical protein J437_LFUL002539 [Ladona fulva]|uniref:Mutator-like transposase domain-containing protein n=1 Tax=Ladona fulva TaxID=123851 RepID=A0A8K0PAU3_LADFU|nr:hypothetical protein J437_LFUL002539 [Ladona fulva]